MPSISMFYGIVIKMYFRDHMPPHFHAGYQGFNGQFDFDGELIKGSMPVKQTKLIAAWCALHKDELEANWQLLREENTVYKIPPLQ